MRREGIGENGGVMTTRSKEGRGRGEEESVCKHNIERFNKQ